MADKLRVPTVVKVVAACFAVGGAVTAATSAFAQSTKENGTKTYQNKGPAEWYLEIEDGNEDARSRAAEALSIIGADSVSLLIEGLQHDQKRVRFWAIISLEGIGPEAIEAAVALETLLKDETDNSVVGVAVRALAEMGTDGQTVLLEALKSKNKTVRQAAAGQLLQVAPHASKEFLPVLFETFDQLQRMSPTERGEGHPAYVLMSIAGLRELAAGATPRLAKLLDDPDRDIRQGACVALGSIGPAAKSVLPPLHKLTRANDHYTRVAATNAMLRIAPSDSTALQAVVKLLEEEDPNVRMDALAALGDVGPSAKSAIQALSAYLNKETLYQLRFQTIAVLGAIGEAATTELNRIAKENEDPLIRLPVSQALGSLNHDDIPSLLTALDHKDYSVREWVSGAFGDIGDPAVPALAAALMEEKINQTWVIAGLRGVGTKSVPVLLKVFNHRNPAIRQHAISALGAIAPKDKSVVAALRTAKRDVDRNCRRSAQDALNQVLRAHPELSER